MKRGNGFTLIEMLIVLVIIGLTSLIALPRLNRAFAQSNVLSAKARVAALYNAARATAVSSNQTATLRLNGNQVMVYASPRRKAPIGANTLDTIVRPTDLSTSFGVTLSGGYDSVRVASSGLGMDSAAIVLTKYTAVDTLYISRYGRVLK
ncbi:MAG TPA: type II secretion system protein [Gemmatimonadales bacterium]|nr:type II secretion system protein [Gemmatimonadales bacterium]